jgi:ATP-binding cassette subfamily D (ALD) protein 3
MVIKLMESFGRLLMAGREFARLSAYTQRVTQLMRTIRDEKQTSAIDRISPTHALGGEVVIRELVRGSGTMEYCAPNRPLIQFLDVPLCTPNGDILLHSLNLTIHHGQHVIITGPNGCGKSSFFRLLGELWPLYGGKLIKPQNKDLFYIPQKPYLTLGTFRDQIIYPDTVVDMRRRGRTDLDLMSLLDRVELGYLLERESFGSIQDWAEVLSGGEKQRVAIARLIYHRPSYAILDECTSAVSVDVEQRIYKYLTEVVGCSLLSVTHRVRQLQHFHHFVLKFDGCGGYTFQGLLEDGDAVGL